MDDTTSDTTPLSIDLKSMASGFISDSFRSEVLSKAKGELANLQEW